MRPSPQPTLAAASTPKRLAPASDNSGLEATGYVVARKAATISANVPGRVVQVLVEVGDKVYQGQVLARLDDLAARAELTHAQISKERARLAIAQADSQTVLAEQSMQRVQALRQKDFATQAQMDDIVAQLRSKQEASAIARAEERLADADVRSANTNLQYFVIRAPFDGVVTDVSAHPGEVVSPGAAGGFIRTGIASLVDPASLGVEAEVPERYIDRVAVGQPVTIRTDGGVTASVPGVVRWVAQAADRQKGVVRVGLTLTGARVQVRTGMEVNVRFGDPRTAEVRDAQS